MMHKVNRTYTYDKLIGNWITDTYVSPQHQYIENIEDWGDILLSIKSYQR